METCYKVFRREVIQSIDAASRTASASSPRSPPRSRGCGCAHLRGADLLLTAAPTRKARRSAWKDALQRGLRRSSATGAGRRRADPPSRHGPPPSYTGRIVKLSVVMPVLQRAGDHPRDRRARAGRRPGPGRARDRHRRRRLDRRHPRHPRASWTAATACACCCSRRTRARARRCARGIREATRRHRHHPGRRPRVRPARVSAAAAADPRRRGRRRLRLALPRRRARPPRPLLLALGRQPAADAAVEHVHRSQPHGHGDLLQGHAPRGRPAARSPVAATSASSRRSPARSRGCGARIYEVPISYHGRTYAEGKKIGLKDAFKAVWTILRYARWESASRVTSAR